MTVSVTLRQEKTILADVYRVVSWITAASPSGMYPLFVVKEGVDPYDEEFGSVADLDDLANFVENPLVTFVADTPGQFSSTTPGETLNITNAATAVPEWFDTYFTGASFAIATVDGSGDWVTVDAVKPFPTAVALGLNWTASGGANGSNAATRRSDITAGTETFLRRHFTSILGSVKKASGRAESIKALVESIVTAANVHGATFAGVETETYPT